MQAKYNTEMKQAQIELLTKDARIREQELNTQKIWFYFTIGCLMLLILLAFVLYYSYRRIKGINFALEEKNTEIHRQAKQLGNLNITKDKLFSIIGHDLRSPVASLKGLLDVLNNKLLSQEEFIEITGKLKRSLDSVYDDLDNLLQWSQSQLRGLQANPQSFNIKPLTDEKIELFREAAQYKDVTIINELPEESYVQADKNHISLALRNLLANAIKFNSNGGVVRIKSKIRGKELEISVTDSGVGISLDDLNKLFNAETHFTKRGTNEEKGVGIGLLLTKEFVESNGGAIWVTSELGKGSTFTFTVGRDLKAVPKPELV
jgi:signal transduction histidine kinase